MAYSARPTSTDELTKLVNQVAHGFVVGAIVQYKAGSSNEYVLAFADNTSHSGSPLMVSIVIDADSFYVTQCGYVTGITSNYGAPFTTGSQYYLNAISGALPDGPGTLSLTQPSVVGQAIAPIFWADTTSSGYFIGLSGETIESGALFAWTVIGGSQSLAVNNGYFASSGGLLLLALPAISAVGDIIRITALAGTFKITQPNLSNSINFGNDTTTVGVAGYIQSVTIGDTVELVCYSANAGFQVLSSMGNFTVF